MISHRPVKGGDTGNAMTGAEPGTVPMRATRLLWTQRRMPGRSPWVTMLALSTLAGCQPAVLSPAGPVAASERSILFGALVIMLTIVVPTILATLGFAWWFRAGNPHAKRRPDWAYSGRIELVTWGVPVLTIMLLGGVAWVGAHELDPGRPLPSKDKPLEVQVVSLDWKWLFIYPGQRVASVNELVIPAGAPVHFSLTSASVMNAFFIPQLGSMIYTMNGMVSDLHLQADKPGSFRGISSHFSGDGFSDMHFEVQALDAAGFAAWMDSARTSGPVLDAASYAELAKQSAKIPLSTYGSVDPALFQKITSQELAPGPGPPSSGGNQPGLAGAPPRPGGVMTAQTALSDAAIHTTGER